MTNATLIEESNVETLTRLFCRFQISVDGSDAATHDFYRGKGSYTKTERAIELQKKDFGKTTSLHTHEEYFQKYQENFDK